MSSRQDEPAVLPRWAYDYSARQVRILSIVAAVGIGVGCIGPLLVAQTDTGMDFSVLRGIGFAVAGFIALGTRGSRAALPGELDERERAERADALAISYRVIGLCLILGFVRYYASERWSMWLPGKYEAGWLLGGLFWLHLMLPGTILAWRDANSENEE